MQRVSVIAGDGVGQEVTAEALRVLRAVISAERLEITIEELDYGAERYLRDGTTLPDGEVERLRRDANAIFLGALGDPRIPDMRHGREILLRLRFELDLYINLRPVACLADTLCPLKNTRASDIDFTVFRENTEGIYVGVGGQVKRGTADEIAINEDVNTRKGVERIVRAAFEHAARVGAGSVTMADKSNAMRHAHDLWQRTFQQVAADYAQIEARHVYIDALAMELIRAPEAFDVIVTNNLFGDIITDLGAQLQGGMGMAASANLNGRDMGLFEPVHGSAPPLAGRGVANPVAAILSMQLLLRHLGHAGAAERVSAAVRAAVASGWLTQDVGGTCTTEQVGHFIAERAAD